MRLKVISMKVRFAERKSHGRVFGRATSTAKFFSFLNRLKLPLIFREVQFPMTAPGKRPACHCNRL